MKLSTRLTLATVSLVLITGGATVTAAWLSLRSIAVPRGAALISPLELNREHGEVETPNVPVLRVATPVMAPDGSVFGIVVVNVDMRAAFERVRAQQTASTGIYLINERGEYLVHPDRSRE